MIKVNKKIKYGFRAMIYLALQNKTISVNQISESEKIPRAFLEQIIQELKQAGLVKSQRGSAGGFSLAKPITQISLGDIVCALEERVCLADCLSNNLESCQLQSTCLAKDGWEKIQCSLVSTMNQVSLASLLNSNS